MWSHVKRFRADLRDVRGWVITIALGALVVSVIGTYITVFSSAERRTGALTTTPPHEPLGFLRLIDPSESIIMVPESIDDLDDSVLDEPGLTVLLDTMLDNHQMFITLPLDALTFDWKSGNTSQPLVRAVIGTDPPFLGEPPRDGTPKLWFALARDPTGLSLQGLDVILGRPVDHVRAAANHPHYVDGSGRRTGTQELPMLSFDVPTAREFGITSPYTVSEVIRGFTCYCSPGELGPLAEQMTRAETETGSGRTFYAVGYEGLIGPIQRSRALSETLSTGQALGTLMALWCLVVMVAQVFWIRRSRSYEVEGLSGSTERAIQTRSQMLVALTLALPAMAGYELVNWALRDSTWPPPLSPETRFTFLVLVVGLHAVATAINGVRIHRLFTCPATRSPVDA